MGSKSTQVLTVRITNEAHAAIMSEAGRTGKSVKELIEAFSAGAYAGVTPDDVGADVEIEEYDKLGFSGVLHLLRDMGYPDSEIRRINERHISQIRGAGRYNSRKVGDEWGC